MELNNSGFVRKGEAKNRFYPDFARKLGSMDIYAAPSAKQWFFENLRAAWQRHMSTVSTEMPLFCKAQLVKVY
jgi:hypothetical protein